ncbi:hypothetical protein JTF06_11245 [Desemzia sp. RIT804]|uniref:DUF7309 domain-containing protein n=1 Tax=Desemzia sp. RIT 804 TaxID=2810209 RepID=UPI001951EB4A|nr:hypothetical protein [Desemzia sp. RIT 804]MBM6615466.1 hypothetical protein [Desemzia sp. RIT 804]
MKEETKLFQLAKNLYQAAFWEDYWETDILALQFPHRAEPVFISILGKSDGNYGFLFYRNLEELSYYFEMEKQSQIRDLETSLDFLLLQKGISLMYEDRQDLEKEDYDRIKSSSITFRGKKSWPVFIDYKPGFYPDDIELNEVPFVIETMEKLLEIGHDFRSKLDIHDTEENKESVFLRTYKENGEFEDDVFVIPQAVLQGVTDQEYKKQEIKITDFEMRRANHLKIGSSIWELELNYVALPIQNEEAERPRFSVMLMVVDAKSTEIVLGELIGFDEIEQIQRLFLQALVSSNVKPPTVVVNIGRYQHISGILGDMLDILGIELTPVYKLPLISVIQKDMLDFFDEAENE